MNVRRVFLAATLMAIALSPLLLFGGRGSVALQVADAAFPGVNGKIAFVSDRDGDAEIYVVNPDGTGMTRLTDNPAWNDYPGWSPDGAKIAFASDRDGLRNIEVMNADGTNPIRLTTTYDLPPDAQPDWHVSTAVYNFGGFLPPVDGLPTPNVVRTGGAVPVKFSLGADKGWTSLPRATPGRTLSPASPPGRWTPSRRP